MRRLGLTVFLCWSTVTQPALPDEPVLAAKLGPDSAAWQVGPYQGAMLEASTIDADGRSATAIGSSGITLLNKHPIESNAELTVRFRVTLPVKNVGSGLYLYAGQKTFGGVEDNPLGVQLHTYWAEEPESITCNLPPLPGDKYGFAWNYTSRQIPLNRLLMPELTRRRLEQDFASEPTLTKRWLTFRYQFLGNTARVWLDGRLLREAKSSEIDTRGFLRLQMYHGVQLAEVSLRELPTAGDPRFEMVGLEHDLNSAEFAGVKVARESLPAVGQTIIVGGIPFQVPPADERGRNHIDLKPSWLSAGLAEGSFDPAYGDLARWQGAMTRNPGRIQFRIPNGQYAKLHLLAAFSGEADTTPTVTAQFYRESAGHPVNFASTAPAFAAKSTASIPIDLGGGKTGHLHRVTINLDPNGPVAFHDQRHLELELTKEVQVYRAFPDPNYYSQHGGGLPSGVHIFGMTLEKPAVEVDLQPDQVGHIWTAPDQPSYTAKVTNTTDKPQSVNLELATVSHDQLEKTTIRQSAQLLPGASQFVKLPLSLKRYGHHDVTLKIDSAGEVRTQTRSVAYLHPDTRERGGWTEGKGPIFGMWDWNGGHVTMSGLDRLKVLAQCGMESSMSYFTHLPEEDKKYLESIGAKSFFLGYQLSMGPHSLGGLAWDPSQPAEMQAAFLKWLKEQPNTKPSAINQPELSLFFAEPIIGPISYMSLPEYYGDPDYVMTADEKANFKRLLDQFLIAGQAIKKEWPNSKLLLPWGIPSFPIAFLRESPEATELMDGPAIDLVLFERMPEMQCHQVTVASTMWQTRQEWLKRSKKPWPKLSTIEGPGTSPARPGAVTAQQEMDHTVRVVLILAAYNTDRFLGWPTATHCAGAWGEQHYGSGLLEPLPLANPRPVYSAYATLTRQLNRMNFVKICPTPTPSVFCLQFQHYQTGEMLYVLWTLRGKRAASLEVPKNATLHVYDSMDNASIAAETNGKATFTIGTSPVYVHGLTGDSQLTLGTPDHSDSKPGIDASVLAELGDGSWKLSHEPDKDYEEVHLEFIKKFPGSFTQHAAEGPDGKMKATAVRLEKQEKERRTMPFYTTLRPAQPVAIPGKASHLGLWVKAASDWGRVVYCLKDAKGERWLSVGKKGEWNVDDVHNWSAFNYDGWRYLTFELPGNQPYDLYRDAGTSFWGNYGGDMIVDLPLTLEKIIVERRTHVIHATEQRPALTDDVALGTLYAEYARPYHKSPDMVRQGNLRMPLPEAPPNLANPIQQLTAAGTTAGPDITQVTQPEREYDGRRCHVHFAAIDGATSYDVWVSTYPDGRGAIPLAKDWTAPGQLLTGLSPNVDLYLFAVAKNAEGKASKPGKGFKVNLKDMFAMK